MTGEGRGGMLLGERKVEYGGGERDVVVGEGEGIRRRREGGGNKGQCYCWL